MGDLTKAQYIMRRKLLAKLFQAIWQKDGQIVAVRPQPGLTPYFTAIREAQEDRLKDPKGDPDSEVTKAGARGFEPGRAVRALLGGSARMPTYRRTSPRILTSAPLPGERKYPGNNLLLRGGIFEAGFICHAEGRGFESLQPLFRESPACGGLSRAGEPETPIEPSPRIAVILGTNAN
jgi:hypothetical protein